MQNPKSAIRNSEPHALPMQFQVGSGVDPYANARLPETEQELQERIDAREAQKAEENEADGKTAVGKDIQASVLSVEAGRRGSVLMVGPGAGLREFKFDSVVGERGHQSEVYSGSVSNATRSAREIHACASHTYH